jgi:hypothetical protein
MIAATTSFSFCCLSELGSRVRCRLPLTRKSALHIRGTDVQHDPFRSTQKRPVFSFGPGLVVFPLHVSFPFAQGKVWAPSILVRLSRLKENIETGDGTQWEARNEMNRLGYGQAISNAASLALKMIQTVASWLGSRKLRMLGYCQCAGGSIRRHWPVYRELISRMKMLAMGWPLRGTELDFRSAFGPMVAHRTIADRIL